MTEMTSEPKHSNLVEDSKKKSAAFVADWKKRTHHTTQTTLQTKSEAFTAWCLTQGWAMKDMRTWTTLCEKAKYSVCDGNVADELKLLLETVDLADHINCHPVGLICYARCEMKIQDWNLEGIRAVRDTILEHEVEQSDDVEPDGGPAESGEDTDVEEDEVLVCPGAPTKRPRAQAPAEEMLDLTMEPTQLERDFDADIEDK